MSCLAEPKSHNFKICDPVSTRMFYGLMSLWQMPLAWIYAIERSSWYEYIFTNRFGTICFILRYYFMTR